MNFVLYVYEIDVVIEWLIDSSLLDKKVRYD